MTIANRIQNLRLEMKAKNIDFYIVPSADYHQSEYVGDYFKARAFISGFTGSAGTVVIGQEKSGLWTDGRYFIQAEGQLQGSGIDLYKMGEEGVPTIAQFIEQNLQQGMTLGFDGRTLSLGEGKTYSSIAESKGSLIHYTDDLIDKIWENRPALPTKKAFYLDIKYSGEDTTSKLSRIREEMTKVGATSHIISTLDDIAWILNIRGYDVANVPVVLSYMIINNDSVELFADKNKFGEEILNNFEKDNINIHPYNDIYEYITTISGTILLDDQRTNFSAYNLLPTTVTIVTKENPAILFKARKNKVELANIRQSHIKDGIAVTKLMHYLKTKVSTETITEISVADKVAELRKELGEYIGESFSAICGYKEHAALMHYSATEETNYTLKPEGLFLIDSGVNYIQGSTDITRTFALGPITEEEKTHFTAVVRGMINLSRAKFLQGARGHNLDVLARGPVWELGIDYKCGTGHGVGYLLSIHEGPAGFRWQASAAGTETRVLEEGMVITNEPGIYIEGSHGIRIENELIISMAEKNVHGQFMNFEVITFAPIDLDAINPDLMAPKEKEYLNNYHQEVFNKISPFLNEEECAWLKEYTKAI